MHQEKDTAKEQAAAYFFDLDDTMQTRVERIYLNDEGAEEKSVYQRDFYGSEGLQTGNGKSAVGSGAWIFILPLWRG